MKTTIFSLLLIAPLMLISSTGHADGPDCYRVTGVAKTDTLALRADHDFKSKKLADIPHDADGLTNQGDYPEVSDGKGLQMSEADRATMRKSRWSKVIYKGQKGWAKSQFLTEGSCPD